MSEFESDAPPVVMAHPDEVNRPSVKALAEMYGASVVGNQYCPRGQAFLMQDLNQPEETTP